MYLVPVQDSSQIMAIGYEPETSKLRIQFKSKKNPIYEYDDVPIDIHKKLVAANSKGRFFHEKIKGVFTFRKLS